VIGDILQPTHLLFVLVIALLVLASSGPPMLRERSTSPVADLRDGSEHGTRELVAGLMSEDGPEDKRLASGERLASAHALLARTGAERQREGAARCGPAGVIVELIERFETEIAAPAAAS